VNPSHCESTSPRSWKGDHDLRPLTETGAAQARALVPAREHPRQRIVACSHGDVIPALLSTLCAAYDSALPPIVGRGGWHTLRFDDRYLVCSSQLA